MDDRATHSIQWKGDNIINIYAFMLPAQPQYMNGFSDADQIVGVWTPDGLKVARLGDWITKLPDGTLRVDERTEDDGQQ